MELFRKKTNIDFVGKKKYAFTFSALLILITIASLVVHGGPRYGIDFAGGVLMRVKFSQPVTAAEVKDKLKSVHMGDSLVQEFEEKGQPEFLIHYSELDVDIEHAEKPLKQALSDGFGKDTFEVRQVETVGPKVGKDLRQKGLWAVMLSWMLMLIYVSLRFEFGFGLGGIMALVHDVAVTVGAFSLTNKEIDLTIIAALLTIVGFSINDTIVIFDRVRENRRKYNEPISQLINRSVNETLSRTFITTGTLLMAVLALYIFGGSVIHNFAFAMLVGCISGTYSTLYIATPFVIYWDHFTAKKRAGRKPVK
ncbi:MAG TPA: protein translocase subunit SecF [Thermodesulfobacteriota bacterium]|nr:protein translocase subunit SecF [Deltaproteobacteria bacterium]HNR14371.1 protein translocase subunit SecF [Thermodesulfobacteriota bacterium]HNU70957.1 protein translocase subunit SecF [Thermodesulfobacteriota bacterium]HOC38794.1 protein translocase subunit SecF [Thermodesulfobacteriota bacterium]HQO77155.1 protein translocase subunit SecF [Thermodesulfobacteriota bacterium]